MRRTVPIILGTDAGPVEPQMLYVACMACASVGFALGADGLCGDATACCARYRGGVSPQTYAAGLRGELLGVAL